MLQRLPCLPIDTFLLALLAVVALAAAVPASGAVVLFCGSKKSL
ncbi:MAG: hypothetical protein QOC63_4919, partial [Mycobacterium sp.]|nr:hypothetical protein [Mycobacterium sp.]